MVKIIYFQCKEFILNEPPSNGLLQLLHASSGPNIGVKGILWREAKAMLTLYRIVDFPPFSSPEPIVSLSRGRETRGFPHWSVTN